MLVSFFLGMTLSVQAEESFSLEVVKQEIVDGKPDKALNAWSVEREKLSCPTRIPDSRELAQFWVYKGYAHYMKGVAKGDQDEYTITQENWRKAFVIDTEVQFDESFWKVYQKMIKTTSLTFLNKSAVW